MQKLCRILFVPVLLVSMAGCFGGGGSTDTMPVVSVNGTVTMDGSPLEGAMVHFIPSGETLGNGGMGITDGSGNYKLSTPRQREGIPPGTYIVVISKKGPSEDPEVADDGPELLPGKYSEVEQTSLRETVGEGGGTFNFDLKS